MVVFLQNTNFASDLRWVFFIKQNTMIEIQTVKNENSVYTYLVGQ